MILRPKRRAFVVDPPWDADQGGGGKGANYKYPLMSVDEIAWTMRRAPPWSDVGDALMFMWATSEAYAQGDAHALVRALGFRPCSNVVWAKIDDLTDVIDNMAWSLNASILPSGYEQVFAPPKTPGMGQWTMQEHEHLIICRRGDVDVKLSPRPRSMIYAPRGEHSEKPEKAWTQVIEPIVHAVLPDVRIAEFFARRVRPGTTAWGHLDGTDKAVTKEG